MKDIVTIVVSVAAFKIMCMQIVTSVAYRSGIYLNTVIQDIVSIIISVAAFKIMCKQISY